MDPEIVPKVMKMTSTKQTRNSVSEISIPLRSVLVFLVTSLATAIVLELLPLGHDFYNTRLLRPGNSSFENAPAPALTPAFAIYESESSQSEDHLIHVKNVLERLGYQRKTLEEEWDLLWAHDYPFLRMPHRMKNLLPHQVVNHLPGCGFITNKVDLSTTGLPFMPRAFRLPKQRDEFIQYANNQPDMLFVEKHNEHRHITITPPSNVNLSSTDSFVQEFVQNPFLVDGYKFDIGVYVVITSVQPLRVYIYTGDVLFRYCPVKYYPFDPNDVNKYVVGDDYLPTWEVPSLIKYYNHLGGSMRGAFDEYVRDQALDPSVIWTQVEDIIMRTILAKEADIAQLLKSYKTRNFFELLRFDLIIDERLRVHLMEANMSPNLSSAHFKPNSLLYEQILYSVLNLVGIGSPLRRSNLKEWSGEIDEMLTADKNLATNLKICAENKCSKSCNSDACDMCLPCFTGTEISILKKTYREHLHKVDMRRIFPHPIVHLDNYDVEAQVKNMTKSNKWMTRWFYAKCQYDRSWCS